MITGALIGWVGSFVTWFVGILPAPGIPSWLGGLPADIQNVGLYGTGFGVWFPFGLTSGILGSIVLAWSAGLAIKVLRIAASFFTAGGGSAA